MPSMPTSRWIPLNMPGAWWIGLPRRSIQIAEFSYSGRKVLEYDVDHIREIIEGSFRIIYAIKPDQIDVLAVIHAAMDVLGKSEKEEQ